MKIRNILSFFFISVYFVNSGYSQNADKQKYSSYTIKGTIYAGTNKLPEGKVYLIRNNRTSYQLSGLNRIVNGEFQFNNVAENQYLIYVIPELNYDFLYFPKYIPTYFGKTYSWEKASFSLNKNVLNKELSLLSYQSPFYGNKKITGKLKFSQNYRGSGEIPIPVILLNENFEPMDFRIAEKSSGKFSFEYLPDGIYYIHPEIPGSDIDDYKVNFLHNHSGNSSAQVSFNVSNDKITVDRESDEINPVLSGHYLNLYLSGKVNYPVVCELIDLSGRTVVKELFASDKIAVNTDGLAANIYIVKVKTYDNSPVKTAKVFIRNY